MNWFFTSNDTSARLLRTIVQGILGVITSYLAVVAASAPEIVALLIIPLVMAVLSPIMGEIGNSMKSTAADDHNKVGGTDD